MCAVVTVILWVCNSVRLSYLFCSYECECPINPVTSPNLVSIHSHVTIFNKMDGVWTGMRLYERSETIQRYYTCKVRVHVEPCSKCLLPESQCGTRYLFASHWQKFMKNEYRILFRRYLEDFVIDGRIILKWTSRNEMRGCGLDSFDSWYEREPRRREPSSK
jgi:hypothetical protein